MEPPLQQIHRLLRLLLLAIGVAVAVHCSAEAGCSRTGDETRRENALAELAKTIERATVRVLSGADRSTGVLVSQQRLVLTTAHGVHPDAGRVTVWLSTGETGVAEILLHDSVVDVAVLKLPVTATAEWSGLSVDSESKIQPGNFVLACGFPGRESVGLPPVLRLGTIQAQDKTSLRSSCLLTSGDSGGPLVSIEGKLIAIHHRIGTGTGQNLHRSIKDLLSSSEALRRLLCPAPDQNDGHSNEPAAEATAAEDNATAMEVKALLTLPVDQQAIVMRSALERTLELDVADGETVTQTTGTLLSPELAVAKLSELRHQATAICRLQSAGVGSEQPATQLRQQTAARVIGFDRALDIAVLRLDTKICDVSDLLAEPSQLSGAQRWQIVWQLSDRSSDSPRSGAAVSERVQLRSGLVARVNHHEPELTPRLGVRLKVIDAPGEKQGVEVEDVSPNSAASLAGLRVGDVLVQMDDDSHLTLAGVAAMLESRQPGDWMGLQFRRGGQSLSCSLQLQHDPGTQFERTEYLDGRSGPVSMRRSGFVGVTQHDLAIQPHECGGPVFDRDGRVAGINIARRARESSLMIPIDAVVHSARELVSRAGDGESSR